MTGVLVRRRFGHRHRDTEGGGHVTTEAEIRVMQPQAKEHQGLPASTRRWEEA